MKELDAATLKLEMSSADGERAKLAAITVAELKEALKHKDDAIAERTASIAVLEKQVRVCSSLSSSPCACAQ